MNGETKDGNATTVVIDGQHYTYECWLITPPTVSGQYAMPIPGTSIKELQIRDSIYDLFPSASLVVENTQGGLFSVAQKNAQKQANDVVLQADQTLYIESAGRDLVYLKIKPIAVETTTATKVAESWALGYLFNILDSSEAGINESTGEKFLTFNLVDVIESYLDGQNFDWNTGFALTNHLSAGALNLAHSDIQCPSGIAIKEFLKFALGDVFAIEFAEGWPVDGGSVRYSSAPFETGLDTLKYLYNSYGHENGPSILKTQPADYTGTFKRLFSLRTLSDICKGVQSKGPNGEVQPGVTWSDCFILNSGSGPAAKSESAPAYEKKTQRTSNKVSTGVMSEWQKVIDQGNLTGFENYLLDGIKIEGSRKFLTTWKLHSYDECSGQFDIQSYPLSSAHDDLQSLYVDHFPVKEAKTLIPTTPVKEDNKITNTLHTDHDSFNIQGKNAMLFKSLFLGPVLSFKCKGRSYRKAGEFISITSQVPPEDTNLNNVLYGEWFVSILIHRFTQGTYNQHFGCSKFYTNRRVASPMTHIAKKESKSNA